jgi:hypothetical protein
MKQKEISGSFSSRDNDFVFLFFCSTVKPDFPLIPASKGFCLTLVSFLDGFHKKLKEINAVS